ncbi:MAG: methyltransferase, partial [Acidobacteria bacterium]|nr:methyltransferase [Acidobacteriota bacterium]
MSEWAWIENGRYWISLMLWLTLPPAILFWLLVHPFAAFWRRLGPAWTFTAMAFVGAGVGYVCWLFREPVLEARYPFRWQLAVVGLVFYALAAVIEVKCRKHLRLRILVGMPELAKDDPGKLLTEGIYGQTRNPRYLDLMIGLAGWSLILNYRGIYWLVLASFVGIYLIVLLEESELRQRFGAPYEEYLRRVPRFLPRSWAFLR